MMSNVIKKFLEWMTVKEKLHNTVGEPPIRTVDYRRLSSRLGVIDEEDFKRVKEAFMGLYK